MAHIVYSKPSGPLIAAKTDFFEANERHLDNALRINRAYAAQPRRTHCKTCGAEIGTKDFESFGVGYSICQTCGHVNGLHEDTQTFVDELYAQEGGANYKEAYLARYDQRVRDIYLPKVHFLQDTLAAAGDKADIRVTDMGCGGGHFVRACELRSIEATGFDPSKDLVELGNSRLERNALSAIAMDAFEAIMAEAKTPVISMIGVLEHLREPLKALEAFKASDAQYLYISVPLFSFSAMLEHAHPDVFPRQLSGGHTHLYTEESLAFLAAKYELEVAGEWWFGTDLVDLFRTLLVSSDPDASEAYQNAVRKRFGRHLDAMQSVLDEAKTCSEVHLIWRKA